MFSRKSPEVNMTVTHAVGIRDDEIHIVSAIASSEPKEGIVDARSIEHTVGHAVGRHAPLRTSRAWGVLQQV
jgi:hypothetical protein